MGEDDNNNNNNNEDVTLMMAHKHGSLITRFRNIFRTHRRSDSNSSHLPITNNIPSSPVHAASVPTSKKLYRFQSPKSKVSPKL
jgi:hypothetical protein